MKHSRRIVVLASILACASCGTRGPGVDTTKQPSRDAHIAQPERQTWNFDSEAPGSTAAGFVSEVGEWKIVADTTAPSPGLVLAQQAENPGEFNIVLIEGTHYGDLDISVKLKSVSGEIDQGGGLVWRAKDADNYYIARYNPLEDNYRVYKVVKGRRIKLQSARIERRVGWHHLRVTMRGKKISCLYDGKEYLKVEDSTFQGPGKVGLWTKADAITEFDDLVVKKISAKTK